MYIIITILTIFSVLLIAWIYNHIKKNKKVATGDLIGILGAIISLIGIILSLVLSGSDTAHQASSISEDVLCDVNSKYKAYMHRASRDEALWPAFKELADILEAECFSIKWDNIGSKSKSDDPAILIMYSPDAERKAIEIKNIIEERLINNNKYKIKVVCVNDVVSSYGSGIYKSDPDKWIWLFQENYSVSEGWENERIIH